MTTAENQLVPSGQPNSPPTKASLASWWERFKQKRPGKDTEKDEPQGIFGVPLHQSINYANVAISITNADGQSQVYGYIPVVVAKCGVFLKEKATDVEGIFRLSGSAKRIKDLQSIFNSPEKYGKGLDWTGYTVHDAANVLRRYLNLLPEPIIPLEFYNQFRDPLTTHSELFDTDRAIKIYQKLISGLPPLNRQLLLYILDLLAVFASKSDQNLMTAVNLAAIFQPGLISHPSHEMAPAAYKLSQDVLVFLINHQDHFLLGMKGVDDDTLEPPTPSSPSLRHSKTMVARSASTASAGAESVMKYGGVRRNVSVNSRKSTQSPNLKSSGVSRSNTLPSRRSSKAQPGPNLRSLDGASSPISPAGSPIIGGTTSGERLETVTSSRATSRSAEITRPQSLGVIKTDLTATPRTPPVSPAPERLIDGSPTTTPSKEWNFSSFFALGNEADRPTRKLRKKRIPGSSNHSAESSTTSLPSGNLNSAAFSNAPLEVVPGSPASNSQTMASPIPIPAARPPGPKTNQGHATNLIPTMSPTPSATSSVTSHDSAHSYSDTTNTSAVVDKKKKRPSGWRWSRSKVDRWDPPTSPVSGAPGASNGGIAERIRRVSRSPPGNRLSVSEGSGDDDAWSNRGALGWFKRMSAKEKDEKAQPTIPARIPQIQHSASIPSVDHATPIKASSLEEYAGPSNSGSTSDMTTPRATIVGHDSPRTPVPVETKPFSVAKNVSPDLSVPDQGKSAQQQVVIDPLSNVPQSHSTEPPLNFK